MPAEYGPATTVYNRWSQRGVWQRMFERLTASGEVPPELMLDSTHVKTRRFAAGVKGGGGRKRLASRAAAGPARHIVWPTLAADRSRSA